MVYFQVHRSYVLLDDITGGAKMFKDHVGIARFERPLDARQFILRPKWTEEDLSRPEIQWDCSHEDMLKQGWDLSDDQDKEPTEAVDSGLLIGDEVPVVLRHGRGFAGLNKIMAVLPTLPPNPWLYDQNPRRTKVPKLFVITATGGRFLELEDLRPTEATQMDNSYHPILPTTNAFIESFGKKMKLYPKITAEHTEARTNSYLNSADISMGSSGGASPGRAYVDRNQRFIDLDWS